MKIEYEFDEPDYVLEYESNTPFSRMIPALKGDKDLTFKEFLESDKILLSWHNKTLMATKKLRTKCYFLTKDWMVYEVRFKK